MQLGPGRPRGKFARRFNYPNPATNGQAPFSCANENDEYKQMFSVPNDYQSSIQIEVSNEHAIEVNSKLAKVASPISSSSISSSSPNNDSSMNALKLASPITKEKPKTGVYSFVSFKFSFVC